jgi:hypothetical protein
MIFLPAITIWIAFLADNADEGGDAPRPGTDIRPFVARLVANFPVRCEANELGQALDYDILPNVPEPRLASWVRDSVISIAIAVGATPAGDGRPDVQRGYLTRVGDRRPFTMPQATGSFVRVFPWVARELLRRLAQAPYPITLENLRLTSGNVYQGEPPDGIEDIAESMWKNLGLVAAWETRHRVDLSKLTWAEARRRAVRDFSFAAGVGAGDPVTAGTPLHVFEDGWRLLRLDDNDVIRQVAASMELSIEDEHVEWGRRGRRDTFGFALLDAAGVPVLFVRTTDFFGRVAVRRTVPQDPSPEVLRHVLPQLARMDVIVPPDWVTALEAEDAVDTRRYDEIQASFREFARQNAGADGIDEDLIEQWAEDEGLEYLGAGSDRVVVAVPAGALKIVADPEGSNQNRWEAERWEQSPAELRQLLVPVLAQADDLSWILMERVGVGGRLAQHERALLLWCGIDDLNDDNVSTDGRILDYGFRTATSDKDFARCLACGSRLAWRPDDDAIRHAVEEWSSEYHMDPQGWAEYDPDAPTEGWYIGNRMVAYDLEKMHPDPAKVVQDALEILEIEKERPATMPIGVDKLQAIRKAWGEGRQDELPPIVVRQNGTLVDGFHRITIAVERGEPLVFPAIVVRWKGDVRVH